MLKCVSVVNCVLVSKLTVDGRLEDAMVGMMELISGSNDGESMLLDSARPLLRVITRLLVSSTVV